MGLLIDLHVHTRRYSSCSQIDPGRLIGQAVHAGLDGLVITEHGRQWSEDELDELRAEADAPGFLVLSGLEYTSNHGDLLIYGMEPAQADTFKPVWSPEEAVEHAGRWGGVCIAAHPTRSGMGFDDRILQLPLVAIEVRSVNLQEHEQRLALKLASDGRIRSVACSDAHRIEDVGRYATEFEDPIQGMADLLNALRRGRFEPVNEARTIRKSWIHVKGRAL